MTNPRDNMREWVPHYERKMAVDEDEGWVMHEFEPNGLSYYAATYRPAPIITRHVGTIAFQGTDAEIDAMIRRTFGIDAKGKV